MTILDIIIPDTILLNTNIISLIYLLLFIKKNYEKLIIKKPRL